MAVDIGYVGTRSLNIPYSEDLNLLRPSTIPFSTARRPYPRYNTASLIQTGGSANYHGFTAQADRRMSRGLWFNANYTWAKGLTDAALERLHRRDPAESIRALPRTRRRPCIARQQLRFSYVGIFPSDAAETFRHGYVRGPLDHVIGGWQFAGITTMFSGARLSPSLYKCGSREHQSVRRTPRPDRQRQLRLRVRCAIPSRAGSRSSTDARSSFRRHGPRLLRKFGAVSILTGPGQAIWNIGIHKNWSLFAE